MATVNVPIETQNQKEMDMKIFIFDKMEPKMEP